MVGLERRGWGDHIMRAGLGSLLVLGLAAAGLAGCAPGAGETGDSPGEAGGMRESGEIDGMADMDGMEDTADMDSMAEMPAMAVGEDGLPVLLEMARDVGSAAEASAHGVAFGGEMELREGDSVPLVSVALAPDEMIGWNLHVQTANFRFAPENVSRAHVPGQGHAHLYLDGEKLARLYGPYLYLPSLPPGEHEIAVRLYSNNHAAYVHDGEPIGDALRVTVPEPAGP